MPIKATQLNSLILIKEENTNEEGNFMDVGELPIGGGFSAGLLC